MRQVNNESTPRLFASAPDRESPSPPECFSLAHLTDLHLTTLENVKLHELFSKRMLGFLSWWRKRRKVHRRDIVDALREDLHMEDPDHIAVTGDLTHLGLPREFAEARDWLASLGTPEQITVIPGNHEAYVGSAWTNSCSMWGPYLAADAEHCASSPGEFFPTLRIRGQVALIGLCSAKPTLPFLATGSLGGRQLARLAELLQRTGKAGLLRIVLVHHPPIAGATQWRKRLTDSAGFQEVLNQYGAELVLHGHTHEPMFSKLPTPAGLIPAIGTPSASEFNPLSGRCARYNIYRLRPINIGWEMTTAVRVYAAALGRFVAEREMSLAIPRPAAGRASVPTPSPASEP